jgi:16S rRNA (adenine1518-N6/adenine1519-N6)-dimethyltransferase
LRFPVRDEAIFAGVVSAAFSQRRKTLRNSLKDWLTETDFEQAAVEPRARAQELSVQQFAFLADLVSRRGG